MSYAWLQELRIDKEAPAAVYMQLRDGLVRIITQGLLQPAVKLPTSRFLAAHFEVHRKTIVAALDVLLAEQWLQSVPRKGLFVNKNLPLAKAKSLAGFTNAYPAATSYPVHPNPHLYRQRARPGMPGFDDGYPMPGSLPFGSWGGRMCRRWRKTGSIKSSPAERL